MSLREQVLGASQQDVSIAAALRAIDAAAAACESARLVLLALGSQALESKPVENSSGCGHPIGATLTVSTFTSQEKMCQLCGEHL
jgi:hypothetical protein